MSTIVGTYVKRFKDANLASAVGVHMNGDYEFFYDVLGVENGVVTLSGHKKREPFKAQVRYGKHSQFITVVHRGALQKLTGARPETVRVVPFKGERSP